MKKKKSKKDSYPKCSKCGDALFPWERNGMGKCGFCCQMELRK